MLLDLVKMMPVLCRGVSVCVCACMCVCVCVCVCVAVAVSEAVLHADGRGRRKKKIRGWDLLFVGDPEEEGCCCVEHVHGRGLTLEQLGRFGKSLMLVNRLVL